MSKSNVELPSNGGSLDALVIRRLAEDNSLLEIGRRAIEDALVEWRDERRSMLTRNNGLVIRERDGSASSIVRFGPEVGVSIALRAIAAHLETQADNDQAERP